MPRTFQLLLCALLLTLFGSAEAKALLSQNHAGDEWRSTLKNRVMGYAGNTSGRFTFCPQLRLQLATGYRNCGDETASGQGLFLSPDPLGHAASMDLYSYCGGDPVNHFDPDGRCFEQASKYVDPYSGQYMGLPQDQQGAIQQQYAQTEYAYDQAQQYQAAFGNALSQQSLGAQLEVGAFNIAYHMPGAANGYQAFEDLSQGNYSGAAGSAVFWGADIGLGAVGGKMLGGSPGLSAPAEQPLVQMEFPFVNDDLSGQLSNWGTTSTAARGATVLPPVVIGENMAGRVLPFANQIGAETYQPGPYLNFVDSMQQQQAWIQQVASQSRAIIDIGPDLARPNFSPYYDLETTTLEDMNYPTINAAQPPSGPPVR